MYAAGTSSVSSGFNFGFVQACLAGNQDALAQLSQLCTGFLRAFLRKNGASDEEAEEISSEIFCECVVGKGGQRSLLLRYGAEATLSTWLARVAHNRFIDAKRRERMRSRVIEEQLVDLENQMAADDTQAGSDPAQLALIREGVARALASCSPEQTVMLRLIYCEGVSQREIAKVWGWTECRVSRYLRDLRDFVYRTALAEVKRRDPFIDFSYDMVLKAFRATR
jgi:RNA polymerase sigma factor (sigma-70 family)